MTTKEMIKSEIDVIDADYLDELYDLIIKFIRSKKSNGQTSLMSKLKAIAISAPADFAAEHDLYVIGEKRVDQNPG